VPGQILFTGPEPPGGQLYCTICAAVWKQAGTVLLGKEIEQAQRSRNGQTVTLDLSQGRPEPELAVAHGIFLPMAPPPNGNGMMPLPVPLCWTHLLGLTMQESAVMPATPAMMPQGPGGAVMLDRRG
jgi:hypothetical protein